MGVGFRKIFIFTLLPIISGFVSLDWLVGFVSLAALLLFAFYYYRSTRSPVQKYTPLLNTSQEQILNHPMSVVGIDFGNLNTVVAVARNRGIDVIVNEVSNRATPSLVSFGEKQRYLGESAKTQENFNFKNTVCSLKRLIGRPFSDPEIAQVEKKFINASLEEGTRGEVAASVSFIIF